jgi:hypothetical protein
VSNYDTWAGYDIIKLIGPGASFISITITNIGNPQVFVAELKTCNFKGDWHPFWQAFNTALDNSPFRD